MKYKNYEVMRDDERNWKLVRRDMVTATHDIKNPKTQEIVHKAGEVYAKETFKGFFGSTQAALHKIVDDLVGTDCADIAQLAVQLGEIKADLSDAFKLQTA